VVRRHTHLAQDGIKRPRNHSKCFILIFNAHERETAEFYFLGFFGSRRYLMRSCGGLKRRCFASLLEYRIAILAGEDPRMAR
jgi:hypothetical protein